VPSSTPTPCRSSGTSRRTGSLAADTIRRTWEALFHQWDNYVRRISFFNRYPDMTDHGPSHANSVVSLVAQLAISPGAGGRRRR
jgi:hypothetical protein